MRTRAAGQGNTAAQRIGADAAAPSRPTLVRGQVLWFSAAKGYGVIKTSEPTGRFVRFTSPTTTDGKPIAANERVTFTLVETALGLKVDQLRRASCS